MLNFDIRKKENEHSLLKSLRCVICITKRWAPHVSMEAMQSTSRPDVDETFPDTHLTACDLHCSAATAAWRAMLIMLHGVTGGPPTSHGLEIWCPVYGHATQQGWGNTLQYCSQDNSRASTGRGSLTRYMRGRVFDGAFKALCASWFAFMAALTQRC